MWKVTDMYREDGIYWYTGGWNLRAIAAVIIGVVPGLPGFFQTVLNKDLNSGGVQIFQIDYFVGFPLGFCSYILFCYIWPPAGLGIKELMVENEQVNEGSVLEGEGIGPLDDKTVDVTEKQKTESDSF